MIRRIFFVAAISLGLAVFLSPALPQISNPGAGAQTNDLKEALKRNQALADELSELKAQLAKLRDEHELELKRLRRQIILLEAERKENAELQARKLEAPREVLEPPLPVDSRTLVQLLRQPIETKGLQEKVRLKTALEYFNDKLGGKLTVLVNKEAFLTTNDPDSGDVSEEEVVLPPIPPKMAVSVALRLILGQVAKGEATYVIRSSYIEIVPERWTTSAYFLYQPILVGSFEKRPLAEVLHELAEDTGVPIHIDPQVGKKALTPVTATFRNSTLEDALVPITEMAQLKYVALERSIFVTTPERAKVVEKEEWLRSGKREAAPKPKSKRLEPAP